MLSLGSARSARVAQWCRASSRVSKAGGVVRAGGRARTATDEQKRGDMANEREEKGIPMYLNDEQQYEFDMSNQQEEPGPIWGQYTPSHFVHFSDDVNTYCTHTLEVEVKRGMNSCFDFLEDWGNLIKCFDLIDSIAEDELDEDCAVVMLFYKWRRTPPLQIIMSVQRVADLGEGIGYFSHDGCPMMAKFTFTPHADNPGHTTVALELQHATPVLMLDWVGMPAFHQHVGSILKENLEVFRLLVEGELTSDGLADYYKEHRTDAYDGPSMEGQLDWLPQDKEIWIEDTTPPEREQQIADYALSIVAMHEAVEEGKYVETEQGWASTELTAEQIAACDELARRYRYETMNAPNGDREGPIPVEPFEDMLAEMLEDMVLKEAAAAAEASGEPILEQAHAENDAEAEASRREGDEEPVDTEALQDDEEFEEDDDEAEEEFEDEQDEDETVGEFEDEQEDDEAEEGDETAMEFDEDYEDDLDEDDEDDDLDVVYDENHPEWEEKQYLVDDTREGGDDAEERILEMPSMKEVSEMSEEQQDALLAELAEEVGISSEDWQAATEALTIDQETVDTVMGAFQRSEEEGRKAAKAAGQDYEQWLQQQKAEMTEYGTAALQKLADEYGQPLEQYVQTVLKYDEETSAVEKAFGLNEEQLQTVLDHVLEQTATELQEQAEKLQMPVEQVLAIQAEFEEAATKEAPALGVSVEELVDQKFEDLLAEVEAQRNEEDDAAGEEGDSAGDEGAAGDEGVGNDSANDLQ